MGILVHTISALDYLCSSNVRYFFKIIECFKSTQGLNVAFHLIHRINYF